MYGDCLDLRWKTENKRAMSGHGDPHDEARPDEHDHEDDHHAPPALPEPPTPLWLTLLGIGLFLIAGILFVATREDGKTTAQLTAVPSAEAAPAAAAPAPNPNPAAALPRPAAPSTAMPNPANPAGRLNAPPNPPGGPGGVAQPAVRPRPAQ
jgi:hypothetical protein